MIDTDKYEGHTPAEKWAEVVHGSNPRWREKKEWPLCLVAINMSDDYEPLYATVTDQILMADAPLLLAEVKRLRKEINQLPMDLHDSLDMILEAYYPEVRESVMAMFGDAWGNNLTGYEE